MIQPTSQARQEVRAWRLFGAAMVVCAILIVLTAFVSLYAVNAVEVAESNQSQVVGERDGALAAGEDLAREVDSLNSSISNATSELEKLRKALASARKETAVSKATEHDMESNLQIANRADEEPWSLPFGSLADHFANDKKTALFFDPAQKNFEQDYGVTKNDVEQLAKQAVGSIDGIEIADAAFKQIRIAFTIATSKSKDEVWCEWTLELTDLQKIPMKSLSRRQPLFTTTWFGTIDARNPTAFLAGSRIAIDEMVKDLQRNFHWVPAPPEPESNESDAPDDEK